MGIAAIYKAKLRGRRGDAAVELISAAAMLLLLFAVLFSGLVYVVQVYSASYICRRVVRTIELEGQYKESEIRSLISNLGGDALDNIQVSVEANYLRDRKIQLRQSFRVNLTASYPIQILLFGNTSVRLNLPITVQISGRSEVFWK